MPSCGACIAQMPQVTGARIQLELCEGEQEPAELPDVLVTIARLAQAPVEPKIKECFPSQLLWLKQHADHLGLEGPSSVTVHQSNATVLCCAEAGLLPWKKSRRRADNDWPVNEDERVESSAKAGQQMIRHWHEGDMVCHHGCQHLLATNALPRRLSLTPEQRTIHQLHELLQNGCEGLWRRRRAPWTEECDVPHARRR